MLLSSASASLLLLLLCLRSCLLWLQRLLLRHEHRELLLLLLGSVHQLAHDVDRDREDDGAVVLGRYAVQCLKITELKRKDGTHSLG